MSLLSIGARCSSCDLVDFLPFVCPSCSRVYCRDHVHTHGCLDRDVPAGSQSARDTNKAGPSRPRTRCPVGECDRLTIEAIGGREVDQESAGSQERNEEVARQVRCSGCGEAFCAVHRTRAAHACAAPSDVTVRSDAAAVRRTKAQEVLAKHFPDQAGKIIPKPPPARDTTKVKPASPPRLPPSLQPAASESSSTATAPVPGAAPKTKAAKLHELHVRKIRSLAKPLDPKQKPAEKRRFFERGVGSADMVSAWKESGKWTGKLDRSWVPEDMPIGKVFDLMIVSAKISRPADPARMPSLLSLLSEPDQDRSASPLILSDPASRIAEGCIVVLVQDKT